jgi:hypothetical protein
VGSLFVCYSLGRETDLETDWLTANPTINHALSCALMLILTIRRSVCDLLCRSGVVVLNIISWPLICGD